MQRFSGEKEETLGEERRGEEPIRMRRISVCDDSGALSLVSSLCFVIKGNCVRDVDSTYWAIGLRKKVYWAFLFIVDYEKA